MGTTMELWRELVPLLLESNVVVKYAPETISDKAFRAMHLWFRQCEKQLNSNGIRQHAGLSGKETSWQDGDFKQAVYKRFLRYYLGKSSTKDQTNNDLSECLTALTAHVAQEYGCTLPMFPSLENMSIKAMLRC